MSVYDSAYSGVRWASVSMLATVGLLFLRIVVLGRLLSPSVFGVVAIVLVVVGVAQIFGELGLSEAIVQRSKPRQEELSTLYWLNISAGFFVYIILFLGAPVFSAIFSIEELREIIPVSAMNFLILPVGSQFYALLQRDLNFKYISIVDVLTVVVNSLSSIVLALWGAGVWALVFGELLGGVARTSFLLSWGIKNGRLPTLYFSFREIRDYLSFGLHRVGAMAVNFFNSRADQLVIGALLGPQALGYYSMSFNLVIQPVNQINPVLTKVAFPLFSKLKEDTEVLRGGYLKMLRLLLTVNAPMLVGLSVVAPVAVPLFLGEEWVGAVPIVQILCFYTLLRSVNNAGSSVLLAKGRADLTFYWNVSLFFVVPSVVFVAAYFSNSLEFVALSLCFLQLLIVGANYLYLIRAVLGPCFFQYFVSISIPCVIAVIMGILVCLFKIMIPSYGWFVPLLSQVLFGFVVYIVFTFIFQREYARMVLRIFPRF